MSSETQSIIAIDIGGTKTSVAALTGSNLSILDRFATPQSPDEAIQSIVRIARSQKNIAAVGIGAPGPLDAEKGIFLSPPNLPDWHGCFMASAMESKLGIPVRLENDANLGALGEAIYGRGRGMKSIFYLTISTGIGAGLIIDGAIHSGHKGMAGELWAFQPDNFQGHTKGLSIMDLSSGPGLLHRGQQRSGNNQLNMEKFLKAALDGDAVIMEILEEGRNAITAMLAAVILAVAPDAVVLGGGLCTDTRWYVEPIQKKLKSWIKIPQLAQTPIHRADLWDEAVLYGAEILARRAISP